MEWFSGNVVEAIQRSKTNGSVFIVLISGDDDASRTVETTMNDSAIVHQASSNGCVAIKLDINSQSGKQFSQIYPVMCVPSVYFINGANGIPLEICGGSIQPADMTAKFSHALELHRAQSNPSAAASAESSRQTCATDGASGGSSAAAKVEKPSEQPVKNSSSGSQEDEKVKAESDSGGANSASAADMRAGGGSGAEQGLEGVCEGVTESEESAESIEEKRVRAEALLAARREQKQEEEKEKARKEEVERRKLGKEMSQFQNWKSDMERKEIETALKKEKEEAKRAREKVREEIERDRRERALKYQTGKESEKAAVETKREVKAAAETDETNRRLAERRENARIQFRLPDGSSVSHMFPSSDNLSVAREFIQQRLGTTRPITLRCTFPKRTFNDEDMSSSLLDLDLAPSAALIVLLSTTTAVNRGSQSSDGFLAYIMAALLAVWLFFTGLFTATPRALSNPPPQARAENSNTGESSPGISDNQSRLQRKRDSEGRTGGGAVRRREGNIHRLRNPDDDDDEDDDESATWNGNSTQQM